MKNINKFDEEDIYLVDSSDMDLGTDIDIEEIDEVTLKRITQATLNKVTAYEIQENNGVKSKKNKIRNWFAVQSKINKAVIVLLCFITVSVVTLGCIKLVSQYVPGLGIISSSSQIKVLSSPYTVWKGDYYLRITSFSYNSDTKELNFTAESNWVGAVDDKTQSEYEKFGGLGMYFKEKWSQSMPNGQRGSYNHGIPTTVSELNIEYKLEKELKDYYLELNIVDTSYDGTGKEIYTEKPSYIVIPFSDLKLVPAEEADGIEDFGEIVESNGISVVAVSRWENEKLYSDLLFKCSDPNEKVISFKSDKDSDIKLTADDNQVYENEAGLSVNDGWKYLLFKTDRPVNGTVELNSLLIEESVDKSIKLDMPKVGETSIINKEVSVNGIKIVVESIRAYNTETIVDDGGNSVSYTLPDNMVVVEVKCRLVKGIVNSRITDDKSYIKGVLKVDNVKSIGKFNSWGSRGLLISSSFNAKDIKSISEVTFDINDIVLSVEGNWEIPIKIE